MADNKDDQTANAENLFSSFQKFFDTDETVKIIFSAPRGKNRKITIKPVKIKDGKKWQIENCIDNKAFHKNVSEEEILEETRQNIIANFRQINIFNTKSAVQLQITKKGKITVLERQTEEQKQELSHDKAKNYIFREGDDVAPLRELGIFTQENKIIKAKYDKYKQINRFIQIIDDEFRQFDGNGITIADFGCGKSYLTFLIYHYFRFTKNIVPKIYGYDINQAVIDDCNRIAEKYGYAGLEFHKADIADLDKMNCKADMVITLHACDTATDHALFNAIKNEVKYIFSVPCCQHEINSQITASGEMNLLLNDGLIKERFSALLTDAVRCEILREEGYTVDVIEFVDFSHSPKNLMIRAKLNKKKKGNYENADKILKQFNCSQKLFSLVSACPLSRTFSGNERTY